MNKTKTGRKSQRRYELAQQKRRRTFIIGGVVGILVMAIIGLVVVRNLGASVEGTENFGDQDRGHDEDVVYQGEGVPPVGGIHSPRWQNCGIYDQPIEAKNAVHSMEHGAVWVTYRPDVQADSVKALQDLVRGQSYVILSPYPEQKSPVVLSAWGIQLEVDEVTDERIADFVAQYRLGPQTPEFGAPCDGGIGQPIG